MPVHTVTVAGTTNKITVTPSVTKVFPQNVLHTVTVDNQPVTLNVATQNVTLQAVQNPVTVSVQADTIRVITAAQQGPQGVSDEVTLLTKATRRDVVEDVPSAGDITIYDGIAAIGTADTAALWLISRTVFTADGDSFDTAKTYASSGEDQVWNDRLSLTYT